MELCENSRKRLINWTLFNFGNPAVVYLQISMHLDAIKRGMNCIFLSFIIFFLEVRLQHSLDMYKLHQKLS